MVCALLILLSGCAAPAAPPAPAPPAPAAPAPAIPAPPPAALTAVQTGIFAGVCEASGLAWYQDHWIVADNEIKDRLFRYDAQMQPAGTLMLEVPVDDIEALATEGGALWVIGSHSRKKSGEAAPERARVLKIGAGLQQPPPLPSGGGDGINIEGAALRDGQLWLGLRAPAAGLVGPDGAIRALGQAGSVRDLIWTDRWVAILSPEPVAGGAEKAPSVLWAEGQGALAALSPDAEGLAAAPGGGFLIVEDGGWEKDMSGCKNPARWSLYR